MAEYNKAINDEEEFLYQKAKVEWISKGDRNNQYFHKVLKSKKQANRICSICDNNGNRLEGVQMEEQFVNHFKRFLAESDKVNKDKDFKGVFGIRLSTVEALLMVSEITNSERKNAMFNIGDNKALGPDGYTFTFFKNAWEVVGNDVCLAIKEFFRIEKLLGEVNATLISLIPKITTPNKVSDYRPIACCNVVYKCISKIITERIKPGLHKLFELSIVVMNPTSAGMKASPFSIFYNPEIKQFSNKVVDSKNHLDTGFQLKAKDSSNTDVLDLPCVLFSLPNVSNKQHGTE
ncbi:hypothetical protein Tco_0903645 [Tanacetum coccineum]